MVGRLPLKQEMLVRIEPWQPTNTWRDAGVVYRSSLENCHRASGREFESRSLLHRCLWYDIGMKDITITFSATGWVTQTLRVSDDVDPADLVAKLESGELYTTV